MVTEPKFSALLFHVKAYPLNPFLLDCFIFLQPYCRCPFASILAHFGFTTLPKKGAVHIPYYVAQYGPDYPIFRFIPRNVSKSSILSTNNCMYMYWCESSHSASTADILLYTCCYDLAAKKRSSEQNHSLSHYMVEEII